MNELKAKRQIVKGSITRIYNVCTNRNVTLDEVKVRAEKLEELYARYEQIQDEIDALTKSAEDISVEEAYRQDIETRYFSVKSLYSSLMREEDNNQTVVGQEQSSDISLAIQAMADTQTSISTILEKFTTERTHSTPTGSFTTGPATHAEFRLPQIQIPEFDGTYTEWLRFRDLFEALVHDKASLAKVEKLEYLQTRLKGEALSLIKHLKPSNDNYEIAWGMLKDKYNKSEHVKRSYMEILLDQAPIKTSNISDIKRFHNNLHESLNALRVLDEPVTHWDSILLYLMQKKLDEELHILWCRERKATGEVKFEHFLKFLEERIIELESLQRNVPRTTARSFAGPNRQRGHPNAYSATVQNCMCCQGDHLLHQCAEFRNMLVHERYQVARRHNLCFNCLRSGHNAASCNSTSCKTCNARHNTLLHFSSNEVGDQFNNVQLQTTHQSVMRPTSREIMNTTHILPTLWVLVRDCDNNLQPCRALLDSGAQVTLISESCLQRLRLKRQYDKTLMLGVGLNPGNYTRGKAKIEIVSQSHGKVLYSQAYCMSKLTQNLPPIDVDSNKFEYFKNITLADAQFNKSAAIDIIMGADLFGDCMLPDKLVHPSGSPIALNTLFGWVIMGKVDIQKKPSIVAAHFSISLDEQLRQFWELEELPQQTNHLSEEEIKAEEHYRENVKRTSTGRYMVRLPFKENEIFLGNSREVALRRFKSLERKFGMEETLKEDYVAFMEEYIALNHMEPDRSSTSLLGYYLPHHAVLKPDSSTTRLRVVFDASCKTSNGQSLNEHLLVGPTIQNNLLTIIWNFRKFKIAMSADIEKMYRQILVHPDDRRFQRVLWRPGNQPIAEYHLNTITYGTSAAPFLATRTLHQVAMDNATESPEASNAIIQNFYVDDFMCCSKDISSALQLKNSLCNILSNCGFNLRKWSSNSTDFIENIDPNERDVSVETMVNCNQTVKTLGILWNTKTDSFRYSSQLPKLANVLTKRVILSDIAKIFDPAGWLAPIIVALKIFMQKLWLLGIEWDQPLPYDLTRQWIHLRNGIMNVSDINIPRWLGLGSNIRFEVHGFADASEQAYAAAVYLKVFRCDGLIVTNLVTAKTRVAPVKQVSLPRLELCAAHLLAKVLIEVRDLMNLNDGELVAWSDSTVVLAWLSDHPRRWKSFVANRTSYILERIPSQSWHHIKSGNNPADLATRGLSSSELLHNHLWWHGPEEMKTWISSQTTKSKDVFETEMERKTAQIVHIVTGQHQSIIHRYSNYTKLVRVTAFILRFIFNCKAKRQDRVTGPLMTSELQSSEKKLVKIAQRESFEQELHMLTSKGLLGSGNKLNTLNPFIDDDGLIRVGGRIENSDISYNQKHPLILHKDHSFTSLIVHYYHLKYLHAGQRQLIYLIGLKYWIPSISRVVRRTVFKCPTCMRFRGISYRQQMGNLPTHRVQPTPPFMYTGVDFAGPVFVRSWKGRGSKLYKAWIAVFVCMTTKALHLELVSELSTAAFLASLRRFVSRRGRPLHIYSDNGTNFVGCDQHLRQLNQYFQNTSTQCDITQAMGEQQIQWHFNPPSAPHFGGLWEASVKSTKYHLRRTLKDAHVTFEEMTTLLCQIEACLNSRPLCIKFDGDVDPLTPAHFLILRSMEAVPDENNFDSTKNYCDRWKYLQRLVHGFWKKWSKEYLNQLQQRSKWSQRIQNVRVNDIVIVKEDNLPPTKWSVAKIIETHPGSDGLIRVVTIKTSRGVYKRPICKLCPLFVND